MTYGIQTVEAVGDKVKIRIREWDGIDKPDYISLELLSPGTARAWAESLTQAADNAEVYLARQRSESLEKARRALEVAREEVQRLEAEVSGHTSPTTWRQKVRDLTERLCREPTMDELVALAKYHVMLPSEIEEQRNSWTRQDKD